jgi:hypothetical protein
VRAEQREARRLASIYLGWQPKPALTLEERREAKRAKRIHQGVARQ